jgi:hypothetical protein
LPAASRCSFGPTATATSGPPSLGQKGKTKMVLVGGQEADKAADLLARENVPSSSARR